MGVYKRVHLIDVISLPLWMSLIDAQGHVSQHDIILAVLTRYNPCNVSSMKQSLSEASHDLGMLTKGVKSKCGRNECGKRMLEINK